MEEDQEFGDPREHDFVKFAVAVFYIIVDLFLDVATPKGLVTAVVWGIGLALMIYVQFAKVYICATIIWLIFASLSRRRRRKGELSAYSVFNEGNEQIAGTFGADYYDQMLRSGGRQMGGKKQAAFAMTSKSSSQMAKKKGSKSSKTGRRGGSRKRRRISRQSLARTPESSSDSDLNA